MSIRGTFVLVCGTSSVVSSGVVLLLMSNVLATRAAIPPTWFNLILVSFIGFAVSVTCAYLVAQRIRRRLYDIEEAAALIASGRLHHRVEIGHDGDEIGQLASQFNVMGETIEQQVGLLQQFADENQRLVAETERAAAIEERQRLARELHDSVSQQLFAIAMLSASAERLRAQNAAGLGATLTQVSELATAAQREMRALLLHLRPIELAGRNLIPAMESFLKAVQERHGITCVLDAEVEGEFGSAVEENLFRILQEAVANVLKHAEATIIQVMLRQDGHMVTLQVMDDGIGITLSELDDARDSYGLAAMRERAAVVGGRFQVWRRDPGTSVLVQIPVVHHSKPGPASNIRMIETEESDK